MRCLYDKRPLLTADSIEPLHGGQGVIEKNWWGGETFCHAPGRLTESTLPSPSSYLNRFQLYLINPHNYY